MNIVDEDAALLTKKWINYGYPMECGRSKCLNLSASSLPPRFPDWSRIRRSWNDYFRRIQMISNFGAIDIEDERICIHDFAWRTSTTMHISSKKIYHTCFEYIRLLVIALTASSSAVSACLTQRGQSVCSLGTLTYSCCMFSPRFHVTKRNWVCEKWFETCDIFVFHAYLFSI